MTSGEDQSPRKVDVERIVREVLAELEGRQSQAAGPPKAANGELALTGKVISMAEIAGRLDRVTRLVVSRGAVFTPAARDELRKRGVSLASAVERGNQAVGRIVLAVVDTRNEPESLVAALNAAGFAIDRLPASRLLDAMGEICRRVAEGKQLGVVMTPRPAAAACLANRHRGVRACVAADRASVVEAAAAIATNLLVVDPGHGSVFELRQMIVEFARAGVRPCPAEFVQRLE
jgi:hypothetical protein